MARKTKKEMSPAMQAYWANSVSGSVIADYQAGNVKVVRAGENKGK